MINNISGISQLNNNLSGNKNNNKNKKKNTKKDKLSDFDKLLLEKLKDYK